MIPINEQFLKQNLKSFEYFDINSSLTAADYFNKTIDNQFGTIANNRCTLTWKNINMRQILGGMYDTYETFKIEF